MSTATIAITLFGIAFGLTQTRYSHVSRHFAMFLAAVAVNNAPEAFGRMVERMDAAYLNVIELVVWFPSSLALAPLFWLYVFSLTSPDDQRPVRIRRHLFLPGLAMLVGVLIAVTSDTASAFLDTDTETLPSGWSLGLLVILAVLQLAVFVQIPVYLVLIVRRLLRYRVMLRDVYSSTEAHELRWIYMIGGLGALFWLASVGIQFLVLDATRTTALALVFSVTSVVGLALVATTTLWGLRQRPPLLPDFDDTGQTDMTVTSQPAQPSEKYEKSALSAEASARIARKLRAAMEQDHLHRDPNLSLWTLARHVGASPNYVSQTFSEEIEASFFDFVNSYRIAEAKELLAKTDNTVLTITYEVGFNARSSFYNAFKRLTGETPTSYRKTLSHPAGLDDGPA
ncbi:helix-turn-helix domain-containing protein [Yoonia sp. 2307UL14-13]|uniref:helix-turn-helix domain-containing protein n=1 Tax=Yoonia sp. 2307UL14-13 TaxID=3126506 RepID=UPI0030B4F7C3